MKTQTFKLLASLLLPLTFLGCAGRQPLQVARGYEPRIAVANALPGSSTTRANLAALVWLEQGATGKTIEGSVVSLAGANPAPGGHVSIAGPSDISGPLITPVGLEQYFLVWQDGSQLYGKALRIESLADVAPGGATLLTPGERLLEKNNYDLAYDPDLGSIVIVYSATDGGNPGLRARAISVSRGIPPGAPSTFRPLVPGDARTVADGLIAQPKISMPITGPGLGGTLRLPYLVVWMEVTRVIGGEDRVTDSGPVYGTVLAPGLLSSMVPVPKFRVSEGPPCQRLACFFELETWSTGRYVVLYDEWDTHTSMGTIRASTVSATPGAIGVTGRANLVGRLAGGVPHNVKYALGTTPDFPNLGGTSYGPRPCLFETVAQPPNPSRHEAIIFYRETTTPQVSISDSRDRWYAENVAALPFDAVSLAPRLTGLSRLPSPSSIALGQPSSSDIALMGAGDAKLGKPNQVLIFQEQNYPPQYITRDRPIVGEDRNHRQFYLQAPLLFLDWMPW